MQLDQPAQQAVLRIQEQFWQALRTKDAALFSAILVPEFVGRSPGEPDQTRDELIARLVAFPAAIGEIAGEAIAVHVFGEVAVLTGVQVARLHLPEGKTGSSRVMLSNVFCCGDQRWRMVLSHAFELVESV